MTPMIAVTAITMGHTIIRQSAGDAVGMKNANRMKQTVANTIYDAVKNG